jgi:RHS repeat-associated protein
VTATAAVLDQAGFPTEPANDNARAGGRVAWYRNYHRYYDPAVGRYTQVDPLAGSGTASLASGVFLHPYGYAASNPLLLTDPTGEKVTFCENADNVLISAYYRIRTYGCIPRLEKATDLNAEICYGDVPTGRTTRRFVKGSSRRCGPGTPDSCAVTILIGSERPKDQVLTLLIHELLGHGCYYLGPTKELCVDRLQQQPRGDACRVENYYRQKVGLPPMESWECAD